MAAATHIEWTNRPQPDGSVVEGKTFNPWMGCTKVSEACKNCYAERDATRRGVVTWGPNGTRVITGRKYWEDAERWASRAYREGNRPLVFCASWADVAEEWDGPMQDSKGRVLFVHTTLADQRSIDWRAVDVGARPGAPPPSGWKGFCPVGHRPLTMHDVRRELWKLVARTANGLDWLFLTKRPAAMLRWWPEFQQVWSEEIGRVIEERPKASVQRPNGGAQFKAARDFRETNCMIPNVWVGATVEHQRHVAFRLSALCSIPAPRRFVSCEPLAGPVVLQGDCPSPFPPHPMTVYNYLSAPPIYRAGVQIDGENLGVHWVITGGESGDGAGANDPAWYRSLRDQCRLSGTPFFFKQWGEFAPAAQVDPDVVVSASAAPLSLPMVEYPEGPAVRFGRRKTGRALDGSTHSEIPESAL